MAQALKIVSTSYSKTESFSDPDLWLERINFYTGVLEELAKTHTVISFERISHEGIYKKNGVEYWFMHLKKKVIYFPWRMHRRIKAIDPDVILVNGLIFPFQLIQLRRAVGKKAKIIVLHRAERPYKGMKRYLQKLADKYVDAYLFTSAEFGKQWEKNITINKIHEVMQASSSFSPGDKLMARKITKSEGNPVFLWVGRLNNNKDPFTVTRAFIEFLKHQPAAKLYMIYQSNELELAVRELVTETGNIELVGKVDHQHLQDWYNSADFIISGSHYEGGGTVISEAMSCGCIPILTDITSFRAITGGGEYGLLYEPGNKNALLEVLFKTRKMDIQRERIRVMERFATELSFSAIARKINAVVALLK